MKHFYLFFLAHFIAISSVAQVVSIPDVNFKTALLNHEPTIDINGDGDIQISEAAASLNISVPLSNISDLTGIEAFTSLTNLNVMENNLTTLDLSANVLLEVVTVDQNPLNSLNVSDNTALQELNFEGTLLTALDLSNNVNLVSIFGNEGILSTLLLPSYSSSLLWISVYANQLTTLDVSGLPNLDSLSIENNQLTTIILNNPLLVNLYAYNNQLSSLNLSNSVNLEHLSIYSNQISDLDLSNNVNLIEIYADEVMLNTLLLPIYSSTLSYISLNGNELNSIDVSGFPNLTSLSVEGNQLTNIALDSNPLLQYFYASHNLLTALDVSNNTNLIELYINNNQITGLDLSNNLELTFLEVANNQLIELDVSFLTNLQIFNCSDNPNMVYLNIKNGSSIYYDPSTSFSNLSNLEAICIDDTNSNFAIDLGNVVGPEVFITDYCSFTPGGEFYTVQGVTRFDTDINGCDTNDTLYPNMRLIITNGTDEGSFYSNVDGNYFIPLQTGTHSFTPQLENLPYFMVSPSSMSVNFPSDSSPVVQDFCITANGEHNDIEITIVPIEEARPGFDTDYKLIYKNKGTTTLSGTIVLAYDDDYMDLQSANPISTTQTEGNLTWDFGDLLPFETREILYTFTLNTPTDPTYPLNGDDILNFTAIVNTIDIDETPEDNVFTLAQTVVNSFDPNDKTCLQGNVIAEAHVGSYVHYLIRFENTGTASAVNVVVRDVIDTSKYDLTSLVPLDSSHEMLTRIRNGNEVEFIFENIQLPFDDAHNDGYVLFKIKTLQTLVVGDSFSNSADIHFDFNFPIVTNNAVTVVEENLGLEDFDLTNNIKLYPNPTGNYFKIDSAQDLILQLITIYDVTGKSVKCFEPSDLYDVSQLEAGMYFITVTSKSGEATIKMVKY